MGIFANGFQDITNGVFNALLLNDLILRRL
jgi:hypothetical protein